MKLTLPSLNFNNIWFERYLELMLYAVSLSLFCHYSVASVVIFIASISVLLFERMRKGIFAHKGVILAYCFLAFALIVAAVSGNTVGANRTVIFIAMTVLASAVRSVITPKLFEKMLNAILLGGCASTVMGIVQTALYHNIPYYRCRGYFTNPNFYGTALSFCILICGYKVISKQRYPAIYYAIAVFNAIGLYLSGSMSLWLVIFIGVLLTLILLKNYKLLAVFLSVVAVGIITVLLVPKLIPRLDQLSATIDNRLLIWEFALDNFKKSPIIGKGFYTYKFLYEGLTDTTGVYKASMSHSMILDGLLCHGIVGMSVITAAVIRFYGSVIGCRKGLKAVGKPSPICGFIIAVGIAVSLYGLMDTTFVWVQTGMILLLISTGMGIEERETQ